MFAMQARNGLSAVHSNDLVQQSWRVGRSSALVALAAENEQLAAEDLLVQARMALTTQFVALQKALEMGVKIVRGNVCTPVTNAQLVCRHLLDKKHNKKDHTHSH